MNTRIHRGQFYDHKPGTSGTIEWAWMKSGSSKGLVFIPPLIGGNHSQQMRLFRWLARKNLALFSFNYSGHGKSSDKFSLRSSIQNTIDMLDHALGLCTKGRLPLFGFASCYSSIPLLFASHKFSEPFSGLVLINPLVHLYPWSVIKSFVSYYRGFARFHGSGKKIGYALERYADYLFPEVAKNRGAFGVLNRERTRLWQVIVDFFLMTPLNGIILPKTPVLCLYGKNDRVLDIFGSTPGERSDYEKSIRGICPLTRFKAVEGDHFLSQAAVRRQVRESILSFLDRNRTHHHRGFQFESRY